MSAYVIANFTVTDPEGYASYGPPAAQTLRPYGAEVVVLDPESEVLEGSPGPVTVVVRFPTKEAARAWYESAEYQSILHLRTDHTSGAHAVICEGATPASRASAS